mmetsp:Transcript_33611/g.77642  ORF Transcript_33611/g.77642 Transcript_33611/m.77642 type:complete len:874 (+) Transcript_33611:212-2833(+)|eukprot:CAMPEP_0182568056 /NCGR_PEP_ID=MMETSP1324-20130603/9109_1 /TAXON_ID=236786 /ORGANISM="Florenciella sp., Strain RCC1587" /LENGTH=873 /DNA_ID=CAMNT_0024782155 /DNA_START=159 /DNA_END=2780 /DNA_ORIENTATION=-
MGTEIDDPSKSIEVVTKSHEEMMAKIDGKVHLLKFQEELKTMFGLYTEGSENAATTERKIQELTDELNFMNEQIASKNRNLDETTSQKKSLHSSIEEGFSKVEVLREAEKKNRAKIAEFYASNEDLKSVLVGGSGWTEEQTVRKRGLQEERDNVMRNLDSKNTILAALRNDMAKLTELVQEQEQEEAETRTKAAEFVQSASERRDEARSEQGNKFRLEEVLQTLQLDVRRKRAELLDREDRLEQEEKDIATSERQLRESKVQMDAYLTEYDMLFRKTQSLTEELEQQIHSNAVLTADNNTRRVEIAAKEAEVTLEKKESAKLSKQKDATVKKTAQVETERQGYEAERDELRGRISQLDNSEIRTEWKAGEAHKKTHENLRREQEILARKLGSSEKTSAVIYDLTKVKQNTQKNLENEISGYAQTVKSQRETIDSLVIDRERHERDAETTNQKYFTALEELKLQEVQISDLQRKIIEGGSRLKQQQNLYEAVRSDRNLYSKNLIESQEEIAEMRRQFKIKNHQIEQLKEEIQTKDHSLVKEHFNHHKVEKEKEQLKNELTKIKKQIVSSEQIIANQRAEIQKLNQIIQEADEERQRQAKEHDAIVGERNILGSQLIRREAELAKIYEKIKIHWSSLQHGEARYQECLAEIEFLQNRIAAMRKERDDSSLQVADISDLKSTTQQLERELLHEQTKVRALSEEMDRPLNVHRWRVLESSDPQRFELVKKIQGLQKRIITKTEEVVEKDLLIQEKERLYVELKNILGRQPGPEVAEQLSVYQSNLKQKLQQMKAMNAELDMYKQQVDEFRYEISNVVSEHSGVKQEYIKRKQEHRLEEEASFGMMGGVGAEGTDSANMGDVGMGTDLMPETSAIEGP